LALLGEEIPARTGEELVRFVRALGQHRYVASRLHLVHLFAIEAAAKATGDAALTEAATWARELRARADIDFASKDERLHRRASDAELVSVLHAFWAAPSAPAAHELLAARLAAIQAPAPSPAPLPFDEAREEDVFPVLVDAGWELVPLAKLDPERHKGAISAFEDFEVARFEDESAVPPVVPLHELPVLGAPELLAAFDEDDRGVRAPFVLWQTGHEAYLDYVLRGALRAAKLG
jgi:hypothetical protein